MPSIEIKKASIEELLQLQKISIETFLETYAAVNSEENMAKYLAERFSLEKLATELCDTHTEFYFACINSQIIGYLKLNFAQSQTELQDDNSLEIERIYVLKEFHGKKIGQLFYEKAIQIARQNNLEFIWLGVWEENHRALNFYKKNGFLEFGKHIFKLGNEDQVDLMMKLKLTN